MFSFFKQLGLKKKTFLQGIPKFFKNFLVGISIPFDRAHGSSKIFGWMVCILWILRFLANFYQDISMLFVPGLKY